MVNFSVKHLTTWYEKTRGLIGYKKLVPVCIDTRFGIHTFGVRKPIDIVILDKDNNVQQYREHVLPNRFVFWNIAYPRVLELPTGMIEDKKIKFGMRMLLITSRRGSRA